ncbi:AAA family ATPase [[Clostridium] polysaccharolyticum]|uniref:AAA domain n=1 Tax=[Clostridium] polysaccharolyticum TaxID=29364 RepID=A0A1H9Y016_9FIRM|nr:AAA family ATPase [[Clostridium] polysaccharolyticum]SES62062.1 AAA domain [[Clostridium] polysaccharolyticum]
MSYQLNIEMFGKIKKAKVEVSPLTFFVGDNNSGKSYLLTLLWGLQTQNLVWVLTRNIEKIDKKHYQDVYHRIKKFITETKKMGAEISFDAKEFEALINQLLMENRNMFVRKLFNSESMSIGKLSIEIIKQNKIILRMHEVEHETSCLVDYKGSSAGVRAQGNEPFVNVLLAFIVQRILNGGLNFLYRNIYFPASRTGFFLAKDSINQTGREKTFTLQLDDEEEKIEPFTMPILNFINRLDADNIDRKGKRYEEICDFIENEVVHGKVVRGDDTQNKVEYIPSSQDIALPMRTSSAIVTELVPLLIILKSSRQIKQLCYEEPEMCLHPELQLQMARILIQLANLKTNVIATTHSDIILQHVNNMCRLAEFKKPDELMERYGLTKKDCIRFKDVSVYQFTNEGEYSSVKKLEPDEDGFHIPTFTNALLNILEQTTDIQEYEEQED